jgi:PAS domain S-box-containing protein
MKNASDERFDPRFDASFLTEMLVEIANEQSLEKLLQKLIDRSMEGPHMACIQVWLTEKGDLCATCPRRPDCPDQSRCLHLAAVKAKSIVGPGKGFGRLCLETAREPLGVPPIGSVVASGCQRAIPDLDERPVSPLDPEWMREEGIRGYAINPIRYKGEPLGAIISATREPFHDELRPWGAIIANHIGGAIANARAFEEIRVAGKRLEQANRRLERELAERKAGEERLRESEQRYRRLVDTASEGIWELDEEYTTTLVNRRMAEMLGYEPLEMVGRKLGEFVFEEDLEPLPRRIGARGQGLTERYEQRYRRKDGSAVWMYVSATSVRDAGQSFMGSFAMLTDITERKRAEDELRKHQDHLEELVKQRTEELAVLNQLVYGSLESADVGAWWIDFRETDTCHALDNTARMVGLKPDPTGQRAYKLSLWNKMQLDTAALYPEHAPVIEQTLEKFAGAISGKYENFRAVHPLALPDGSIKWLDSRAEVAKRDEHRQAQLMTGTVIDITKLKRTEADLEEAKARAEAANQAKSAFLANMSHELRTPLNAVLGFSRLLKRDPDVTPRQQETLDIIARSGEHLLNLINNVLDIAKIESGRVALEESDVDLPRLLSEIQSLMGVGAVEKGLRFALERDPDLPRFVALDAGKLRQVLLNLVGNAIKYTNSGGVKLRARLIRQDDDERAWVRFEVEDTGPGISQEDCQRIFFPFVQLGGQAPAEAGTGLGLAICKQYVEIMGGQIGVTSKPGRGSVFNFTIPVSVLPSVAEPEQPKLGRILGLAEGQPSYRLLIVEDQPENRLLLRRLLDPLGFELREAANGQEAVALFEQWHPDLIWMDIRMPVMDGLEAVRRIRATQAGADTKIIALTAHALDEESKPILAAGCDDLVRKPFREQELFDALVRHLRLKFIYEKAPDRKSTPEAPGPALRPEQLDVLPAELLRNLRQAVIELDTARTQALIGQVTERDASLGRALNTLATQFDYESLSKLLEREPFQTGPTL